MLSQFLRSEIQNQDVNSWFLLEALRKNPVHAFLLASDGCWQALVFLQLHLSHLCLGPHMTFYPIFLLSFSSLLRTVVYGSGGPP